MTRDNAKEILDSATQLYAIVAAIDDAARWLDYRQGMRRATWRPADRYGNYPIPVAFADVCGAIATESEDAVFTEALRRLREQRDGHIAEICRLLKQETTA